MLDFFVTKPENCHPENAVFSSVNEALRYIETLPEGPVTLHLANGIYKEKVECYRNGITIIGESAEQTVISYHDFANDLLENGEKRGTFRSYTMHVLADHVTLKNITIENTSAPRKKAGQALALYADGDCFACESCILKSRQDTLFTAPLPPKEVLKGGFAGPGQNTPRLMRRQYYKDCYICGDIDFIFGGACAYFEHCTIESISDEPAAFSEAGSEACYGYVTAASTPEGEPYGYVFDHCRLISDLPLHSVYLGRPWREYAKTVFLFCEIGKHIKPAGFHDWNKPNARIHTFYAEYGCTGPGADQSGRDSFEKSITKEELKLYTKEAVLSGKDGWQP